MNSDFVILCGHNVSPKKLAEKVKDDVFDVYHGGIEKFSNRGEIIHIYPYEKNGQEQLAKDWLLGNGKCLITFDSAFNGLETTSVIYVQRNVVVEDGNFLSGLSRAVARLVCISIYGFLDILASEYKCKKIEI